MNTSTVGDLYAVAVSPDGRWLAAGRSAETTEPRPIEIWELALNRPLSALKSRVLGEQPGHGYQMVFSPDSRTVYALSRAQEPNRQGAPAAGPGPAFAPLIMGKPADEARLVAYDVVSGKERAAFDLPAPNGGHAFGSSDLVRPMTALTPDGLTMITGEADGTVRTRDASTGREKRSWMAHPPEDPKEPRCAGVGALAVVGDRALLTVGMFGGLRMWDLSTGREIWSAKTIVTNVHALAVSPDGTLIAHGDASGGIRVRDVTTGTERPGAPGHTHWIDRVFAMPDGRTALTASSDGTVRQWDLATGREQRQVKLDGHGWPTAFIPGCRELIGRSIWMYSGSANPYDKFVWDTETGKRRPVTGELADPRHWILTGPVDGRLLVLDQKDQSVSLREWPSGTMRQSFPAPALEPPATGYQTNAAAMSANGRMVAVVGEDQQGGLRHWGRVSLFDGDGGKLRWRGPNPDALAHYVAFLPDASAVVVGGTTTTPPTVIWNPGQVVRPSYKPNQALILLDAITGEPVRSFVPTKIGENGYRNIAALAISSDGRQLAAAEQDFSVCVYEVATGKVRHHFEGHTNETTALAFTPDGRRLVSTSRDLTGLVWDVSLAAGRAGPLPADRDRLWADLSKLEWELAGPALATLAARPDVAVTLLRGQLKPATGVDGPGPAALAALIQRLDGDGFADRERATTELRRYGSDALSAVRERLNQPASAEMKQRLTSLVEAIHATPVPADRLRALRAVELLEQMATPAAKEVLKSLADGAQGATLTGAADDAVKRLSK